MSDWQHPSFALEPLASDIGPFAGAEFLQAVEPFEPGEALVVANDQGLLALRMVDGELRFAGDREVTDYHSPLGAGADRLVAAAVSEQRPERVVFDSLPSDAVKPLVAGLEESGWTVEGSIHEVAAVLTLPGSFDDYLEAIGKKERHETRRKMRRYERLVGEVRHETAFGPGWELDEFKRMHHLAEGDKGDFMTEERAELFGALARQDGWRIDVLTTDHDRASAAVFGWSGPSGYFLYNSSYDPVFADASPGVVLLASMIERAIGEGMPRFDFLKGDEAYKFRLGATERPLTEIVATAGATR